MFLRHAKKLVQRVKNRQPNDAIDALFITVVTTTVFAAALMTWAAQGEGFINDFILGSLLAIYLWIDGSYAFITSLTYRHNVRIQELARQRGAKKIPRRGGEFVGTAFVVWLLLIEVFVAFDIFGFTVVPHTSSEIIQITVGLLLGSSIAKIFVIPNRPRVKHNDTLLFLSAFATVVFIALSVREMLGGPQVSHDMFVVYIFMVTSYAVHNMILALKCPGYRQRRPGHYVPLMAFVFYLVAVVLSALNVVAVFPVRLTEFVSATFVILALSVGAKYLAEEIWAHKGYREEKDEQAIRKLLGYDDQQEPC